MVPEPLVSRYTRSDSISSPRPHRRFFAAAAGMTGTALHARDPPLRAGAIFDTRRLKEALREDIPKNVRLVTGMTATVQIEPNRPH